MAPYWNQAEILSYLDKGESPMAAGARKEGGLWYSWTLLPLWLRGLIFLCLAVFAWTGVMGLINQRRAQAAFIPGKPAIPAIRRSIDDWPDRAEQDAGPSRMASSITVKLGPLPQEVASQPAQALDKTSLAMLIGSRPIPEEQPGLFSIQGPQGQNLYVATTLDQGLQTQVAKWVSQSRAHKAALVALDPRNGRVLAMAGLDGENREANAALDGDFPAASLFKIVTAAAALEKAEMRADSTVAYDGAKHTLFKSNVEKEPDKGRHQATLRESFAESINSVFGKLGAYTVGPDGLTQYADRFGFNQPIAFEMPVGESRFEVDDFDTFRLAELASGFNRLTRVSPIHGAMLAAAAINSGVIFEPTFVSEVFDRQNNILYRSQPRNLGQSVNPKTAEALKELMLAAVTEGTGRKKFSDALSHPILSKLALGGKSGTINDDQGYRVDWFVAFSAIKERGRESYPLALAAVVVHNGQTRMGSQELIRRAILDYYRPKLKDS